MRYRAAGTLLSHEQPPTSTLPRRHRFEKETNTDAALYRTLREQKAIKTYRVGYKFWRHVSGPPRTVTRKSPGHWYYPDSQKKQLYTGEAGDTIVTATATQTIRLLRVRKVFSCPQSSYDIQIMPDGSLSRHNIANPRPRSRFRQFEHHPFLQKAREMMMLADDNINTDAFRLHRIRLPDLKEFSFHGLTLLCDGDPNTIGSRKGEVWLAIDAPVRIQKKLVVSYNTIGRADVDDTDDEFNGSR